MLWIATAGGVMFCLASVWLWRHRRAKERMMLLSLDNWLREHDERLREQQDKAEEDFLRRPF